MDTNIRDNNKSGNLTLLFENVEHVHLGKDVFLFPYYLGKRYGMNVNIVYPQTPTNKKFACGIQKGQIQSSYM